MAENSSPPDNSQLVAAEPAVMRLEYWGWCSVALNVLLASLHAVLAAVSGSLAITAELTHSLVDLLAALTVLVGLKLSSRKSETFPYGLYKVENLTAVGLSIMIFVSAYEIVRGAVFSSAGPIRADGWMLVLLVFTTVLPLLFSHFELRVARAANSPALLADAREYRLHVFTSGLAFVALLSHKFHLSLDRVAAVLIVAAVIKTGWDLLYDAMRVLLDASLDAESLQNVRRIIFATPAVSELRWLTGRNAGRYRFVEAGVVLRVAELGKAEEILRRIETEVRREVPHVERVLLHVESSTTKPLRYAVPLADREGAVSVHFGEAPYFALLTVRRVDGAVDEQRILVNPHRALAKTKGIRVAEWLVEQKIDAIFLRENLNGKGPEYVFRDAGISICPLDNQKLSGVIALLPQWQGVVSGSAYDRNWQA